MRRPLTIVGLILPLLNSLSCESPVLIEESIFLGKTVRADRYFTMSQPVNMQGSCGVGGDSFVGDYTTGNVRMTFDLGFYSGDPYEIPALRKSMTIAWISHRRANVTIAYAPNLDSLTPYFAGVYFPTVSDTLDWKLTMFAYGKDAHSQDTAMAIFRSIKLTM
jgi:hypothetical protein